MALIENHPHQVSIRYPTIDHHLCGGTIIHKNLIITTSSCVSSDTKIFYSNIKILIGTSDGLDLHASRIYELTKNIEYSRLIYPAFLPSQDQRKIIFWVTGWGIDQEVNHPDGIYNSCRYLKKLELKWMTRGRCQAYYHQLHEHQMCSIGKSITSYITEGDAGSPVESYQSFRMLIGPWK
ncbi:uncharacterized protein LOC122859753 [Aphidius gifuensis]|uniref:uncharacterized protein LOC122859753 n=1 Tax=Aphidius gifuensis TaxID=684658 RepID=UPI001CDCA25B|nr:uncharacterized protein LOC122859753 [Aphidius gifuensis]